MIIFELYRPIAIFAKYLGITPLPGLYEGSKPRSSLIRALLDHGLPILNLIIQTLYFCLTQYSTVLLYYVGHIRGFNYLVFTVTYINSVILGPLISACYYLKSGKLTASYIRDHAVLDALIGPKRAQLKRFVTTGYSITFLANFAICFMFLYVKRVEADIRNFSIKNWYFPHSFNFVTPTLLFGAFVNAVAGCQLIFSYIMFHKVLTTAFQQLNDVIKSQKDQGSTNERARMIRHYSSLYNRLSDLSARLDHLFSPVIFYVLFIIMTNSIMIISAVKDQQTLKNRATQTKVILSMFTVLLALLSVLFVITTYTSNTVVAAKKVLPALFYSLDLNSKTLQSEMEMFGLRVMCRKISFTASGFFQIDRQIIHSFISTIISYSVIGIQIKYSN